MDSKTELDSVLKDALETASDAFVVYDKGGLLVMCNQKFRDLYEYSKEDTKPGTSVSRLIAKDVQNGNMVFGYDQEKAEQYLKGLRADKDVLNRNYELTLKGGRIISVNIHTTPSGGTVSIQRDITDFRKQQEELRRSSELFRAAFDADSNICSLTLMETGTFIDVNAAWCKSLGYSREEAIGKTAMELHIWRDKAHRQTIIEQIRKAPHLRDYQTDVITRSGEVRNLILNSEVIDIEGNRSLYFSAKDITEELKTAKALKESQERFEDFTKSSSDWYWETDLNHRYTFISPVVEETTGIPASEYIGATLEEVIGTGARNQGSCRHLFDMMVERKAFRDLVIYRFLRASGKKIWVRTSGLPYFDESGNFRGFRGSSSDITEQIILEQKLQQSQKMEAVGQLTGGVAHDFNNLLAVIQGNAEIVKEVLDHGNPELTHHLDAVMRASDRGAELTQSMLAFSRNQDLTPSIFKLDERIAELIVFIEPTLGREITVKTDFDDNLWTCKADSAKLESAFLNLCLNAREAMPDGGTLNIEIRNREVDENYALMERDVVPGKYVSLIISDTGCGISPEKIPHIIEPFYTTKDVGKGTGLGLSMVYGFARQSDGTLSIYSEVGIGTTVRLLLPYSDEEIPAISETVQDSGKMS